MFTSPLHLPTSSPPPPSPLFLYHFFSTNCFLFSLFPNLSLPLNVSVSLTSLSLSFPPLSPSPPSLPPPSLSISLPLYPSSLSFPISFSCPRSLPPLIFYFCLLPLFFLPPFSLLVPPFPPHLTISLQVPLSYAAHLPLIFDRYSMNKLIILNYQIDLQAIFYLLFTRILSLKKMQGFLCTNNRVYITHTKIIENNIPLYSTIQALFIYQHYHTHLF